MKMNFSDHGVNRKVVENDVTHLNVQYERKSLACFKEILKNLIFRKLFIKKTEACILKIL